MSTNNNKYSAINKLRLFLEKKDIVISPKRYLQDALSAMALGLFASLLVGLILKTAGQQYIIFFGDNHIAQFIIETGTKAMSFMGASVGIAIALGLKAPPLVMFSSAVTGMLGATLGGPAGAFLATAIGAEFGKAVSKETKVDIIVTPTITLLTGSLAAIAIAPAIDKLMTGLGQVIMYATELQPLLFGVIIATIVGLALTAPISSAALCIMLDLSGLAAGAATAGCAAQMVGFAVISFRDNGIGGLVSQGIGTSMLQIPNIVKNPWILLPPTVAGAIAGPVSTVIFKMTNNALGAGMGTSGFVGQIGTFTDMGLNSNSITGVITVQLLIPIIVALTLDKILRKKGKISSGDYKLPS